MNDMPCLPQTNDRTTKSSIPPQSFAASCSASAAAAFNGDWWCSFLPSPAAERWTRTTAELSGIHSTPSVVHVTRHSPFPSSSFPASSVQKRDCVFCPNLQYVVVGSFWGGRHREESSRVAAVLLRGIPSNPVGDDDDYSGVGSLRS